MAKFYIYKSTKPLNDSREIDYIDGSYREWIVEFVNRSDETVYVYCSETYDEVSMEYKSILQKICKPSNLKEDYIEINERDCHKSSSLVFFQNT